MHELAIAMELIEAVKKSAKNLSKVNEIKAELGELNFITKKHFKQVFQMASKGTIAEGAHLEIKIKKGKIKCHSCGYMGTVKVDKKQDHHMLRIHCPKCSGNTLEILDGDDIYVLRIKGTN